MKARSKLNGFSCMVHRSSGRICFSECGFGGKLAFCDDSYGQDIIEYDAFKTDPFPWILAVVLGFGLTTVIFIKNINRNQQPSAITVAIPTHFADGLSNANICASSDNLLSMGMLRPQPRLMPFDSSDYENIFGPKVSVVNEKKTNGRPGRFQQNPVRVGF